MKSFLRASALATLILGAMAIPSKADTVLPPGTAIGTGAATTEALPAGAVALDSAGGAFTTGQQVNGTYSTTVYVDSSGNIDFSYTITNNSAVDSIVRLTANPFNGFTTTVGFDAADSSMGSTDRSSDGSTVGFNFSLAPGQTGTYYIETNATSYVELFTAPDGTGGALSVSDGGTRNLTGFAPVAGPAPASLWGGMGLLGLMGIFGIRRRRLMA